MEEGAKVRLVRCPKCDKILPEYPNVAVYQCGGCGAILQAKNQSNSSGGTSVEKGVEEDLRDVSDALDRKSNENKLSVRRRESGLSNVTVDSASSSSPRVEPRVLNERKYTRPSQDPVDSWVRGNDLGMNMNREASVRSSMELGVGNDPLVDIASRSRRSGQIPSYGSGEAYRRTPRAVADDVRFMKGGYSDEGTSSYYASSYGLVETNPTSSGGLGHLEQDRAELLRKLNELNLIKDQLDRSRDGSITPKERPPMETRPVPLDPYLGNGRDAWFPEGSSRQQHQGQPSVQSYHAEADNHTRRPMYSNHGLEPVAMNRHGRDLHNFYSPQMHLSSEYGDPYAPQMAGPSNPSNLPLQYQRHPSQDYYAAQYMEMDPDHNALHPANAFFHQPACSCAHCYNQRVHPSRQVPPGVRFPEVAPNPVFRGVENRGTFVPQGYHPPRDVTPPPVHHEPLVRRLREREPDAESSGLGQTRPRRVLPVKRIGRRCYPIAGGAPFIVCHSCFELLPLSKKILQKEKNFRKLRCGACSTVMSLLFESGGVLVSVHEESTGGSAWVKDRPVGVVKDVLHSRVQTNQTVGDYDGECDSSSYNSHYSEQSSLPLDERMTLSEAEKPQGLASLCSSSDDDESLTFEREVSLEATGTTSIPGSPLQEYPSSNQIAGKFEKGNRSKRINQDEAVPIKTTTRPNLVNDALPTEMDVQFSDYSNGGMSQEYVDASKDDHPKGSKRAAILGFLGLKDQSKPTPPVDDENVFVNGRLIMERNVRKAEKKAGPILPGNYWYDVRAGFWGVMGQPCLGIIPVRPPFIDELNYPMPENCAGGNTTVCVNGRQLHKKDLDLLSSRGLPRTTYKSYIVEISGKVLDEVSGEELDNLGKLAPTVQKLNHGFGMRTPRSLAQKLAS